jgi:ribose transport system ATP-binding protein
MMTEILLSIDHISKKFPGVQALDDIDLQVFRGEVHAIVGENGAGKSTLMHILSGVIARDSGTIIFNGNELIVSDPRISQQFGIATVYQELALASNMTIMDNIFLGNIPRDSFGLVDQSEMRKRAKELLNKLGIDLDPETPVKRLSVSEKQLVEIAKALSRDAKMIIMDEPNSALSPGETDFLFGIIRQLKERGVTILFISHRLDEVFTISDRITVLRDGKLIATVNTSSTSVNEIVSMMVGKKLQKFLYSHDEQEKRKLDNKEILSVDRISQEKQFKDISFKLRQGEVLGIFGLVGAGRTQMVEAIFGLRRMDFGQIKIDEKTVRIRSPFDAVQKKIGFVPEDRKISGLFIKMAVSDNINMAAWKIFSRFGLINLNKAQSKAEEMVSNLDIRLSDISQRINTLSGGNQQKAIIARWLLLKPKILILDEPTRGIDVGAKAQIYELINKLVDQNVSILLVSSEIEEIMAISDRILVMRRGSISAEFSNKDATSDRLLLAAA